MDTGLSQALSWPWGGSGGRETVPDTYNQFRMEGDTQEGGILVSRRWGSMSCQDASGQRRLVSPWTVCADLSIALIVRKLFCETPVEPHTACSLILVLSTEQWNRPNFSSA